MYVKNIELDYFRNYIHLTMDFHEKVNILLGPNAQGKTNLMEAIYLSSFGKSFRTSRDGELIGFSSDQARIRIGLVKEEEDFTIEINLRQEGKEIKKEGRKLLKMAEMLDHVYVVVFSPEDLRIVKDEPEKRRKFIDRELSQLKPVYYDDITQYKKSLMQRNALLKEREVKQDLMDIWDEALIQRGIRIIRKRKEFIDKLNKISKRIHENITEGKERLEILYDGDVPWIEKEEELRESYQAILKKNREKDRFRGTTTRGPHKDDLQVLVNDRDIRHYGSQGQQRTAALSLKLAEIRLIEEEKGESPILLLDDVLSELDGGRQKFLIQSLQDLQIFITATEISPELSLSLPEKRVYHVLEGTVKKEEYISL
jgi:DNA replication and repair protein RecF